MSIDLAHPLLELFDLGLSDEPGPGSHNSFAGILIIPQSEFLSDVQLEKIGYPRILIYRLF